MMRAFSLCLISFSVVVSGAQTLETSATARMDSSANLPVQKIGRDDLVGITVYDAPELTRTARVASDGRIHLPMMKEGVVAAGLYPSDLEKAIAATLIKDGILVDPVVTVSVVEYRSRPISVVGAVKKPLTFQADGNVTLLDAIARAEGLEENAGADILVSRSTAAGGTPGIVRRIPIDALLRGTDPQLNLKLEGGEEVRVPEAGQVYVVGNVRKPGVFPIKNSADTSILKVLALSEGVLPYSLKQAYIYRTEAGGTAAKSQIAVNLKDIIDRKAPDVPLIANDIIYIPENSARKNRMETLGKMAVFGGGVAAALIYSMVR